jgi:DNA-binding beta-propeller fold protein YncE
VTKLRASDGKVLGTFSVGNGPLGVAFDGADIWVANEGGHTVTELRASYGTVLGTFPGPNSPYGVAFDGTYVWVSGDVAMMVLRASDGTEVFSRGVQSEGVAFDGAYIWTAIQGRNALQKF